MKAKDYDIVLVYYKNEDDIVYCLVYKNTDFSCSLPINEYYWKPEDVKQFIFNIILDNIDEIIEESLARYEQEKKEGLFRLNAWKRKKNLKANIEQNGFKRASVNFAQVKKRNIKFRQRGEFDL